MQHLVAERDGELWYVLCKRQDLALAALAHSALEEGSDEESRKWWVKKVARKVSLSCRITGKNVYAWILHAMSFKPDCRPAARDILLNWSLRL